MTQNFEYFECAETVIKSIEKMSFENPYIMIENDALASLLNLMEFCDLSLRKIALKACVNMTNCINNQEFIKKFITPSIPNLSNLARFSGDSELERTILDLSVQCIYNVIFAIKNYNLNNNMTSFYKMLSEHGILENLYDIFLRYLKIEKDSVYDDELLLKRKNSFSNNNSNKSVQSSNTNAFINLETFKNIIKIFEFLCALNPDIANGILNMNILNVIFFILVKELGLIASTNAYKKSESKDENYPLRSSLSGISVQQEKVRVSSNSQGYFIEIFNLLISLFPNKNSKGAADRLLSNENKNFFIYFSHKILSLILNNIVNIPSSNLMVQIFKLLEMYINYSPMEFINKYIDPVKFSNIANKMLDSKDSCYIMQVFSVTEIIMNKIPTHFIVSFIREGVIDNIKNLINIEESSIYIPNDPQAFMKDFTNFSEGLGSTFNMEEDDEYIGEEDLLELEDNYITKEKLEALRRLKKNSKKEEKINTNVFKINSNKVAKALNSKSGKLEDVEDKEYLANDISENNRYNIFDKLNSLKSNIEDFRKSQMKENEKNVIGVSLNNPDSNNIGHLNEFIISTENKPFDNGCNKANVFSKENQNMIKAFPVKFNEKSTFTTKPLDNNNNNNTNTIKVQIESNNKLNPQNIEQNKENQNTLKETSITTDPKTSNKQKPKKKSNVTTEVSNIIHAKAQYLTESFFDEDKIDSLLKKAETSNNPRNIIKKLHNLKDMLNNQSNYSEEIILKNIVECLFSDDANEKPTFYEIEKSEVIIYFTKYLDEEFIRNWDNSNEMDSNTICSLSYKYNFFIIKKMKALLKALNYDLNKIKAFLQTLQNCISSMNCFKLYIYDISNFKNYSPAMFLSNLRNTTQKLRVKFNYGFDENLLEDTELKAIPSLNRVVDLNSKNESLTADAKIKAINLALNKKTETILIKDENELKGILELNEFFKNNIKEHALNIDLYENITYLKDYFLKLNSARENLASSTATANEDLNPFNPYASNNNLEIYDDIISHIANRKGSEEDINLTEKLLFKIMERKKSFEQTGTTGITNRIDNIQIENPINNNINIINNTNFNTYANDVIAEESNNNSQNSDFTRNGFSASFNTVNLNSSVNIFNRIFDNNRILEDKLEFVYFAVVNNQKFIIKNNVNIIDFFRELKTKLKKTNYTNYANDVQIYFNIYIKDTVSTLNTNQINNYFMENNLLYRIDDEKLNPAWNFNNTSNDLDSMEKIKYFYLHKDNKISKKNFSEFSNKNKLHKYTNNDNRITLNDNENENFNISTYSIPESLENVLFEKFYYENIINNPALYCIKRASPFIYLIALFELAINNFRNIFRVENKDEEIMIGSLTSNDLLSNDVLENLKVTYLLFKQIKDPYAVSNSSIPSWCRELIHNFTYLSGFNSRYLLFKITSFDLKRAVTNLYLYLKNFLGENIADDKNLSTFKRLKYKMDRSKILADAFNLMKESSGFTVLIHLKFFSFFYVF